MSGRPQFAARRTLRPLSTAISRTHQRGAAGTVHHGLKPLPPPRLPQRGGGAGRPENELDAGSGGSPPGPRPAVLFPNLSVLEVRHTRRPAGGACPGARLSRFAPPPKRPRASRDPCLHAAPGRPGDPRAGQRGGADRRGGALPMRGQAAVNLSRQNATQEPE